MDIRQDEPGYRVPLERDVAGLRRARQRGSGPARQRGDGEVRGRPARDHWASGCSFPAEFVGRGDMSRGALLLRPCGTGPSCPTSPVAGAIRRGPAGPPGAVRMTATRAGLVGGYVFPIPRMPSRRSADREVQLTNLNKVYLARAGIHQAGPAAVLRRRFPCAPAAPAGPRHGHEALSQRDSREVVLHEADAVAPAGVAGDLRDHRTSRTT